MTDMREIVRNSLMGLAIFSLVGCTVRPNIIGASIKNGVEENKIVEVILSADDAKKIRAREIYFWIVIVDCKNEENRFAIKPFIDGKPASDFAFSTLSRSVSAQGTIPNKVLVGFSSACVVLEGGSYLFGKIISTPIPLAGFARATQD